MNTLNKSMSNSLILKHHGGWSFYELYNLPVGLRNWFFERMLEEFEREKKEMEKAKRRR